PVYVNFMTEDEFKAKVATPAGQQSEEEKQQMKEAVEVFRALGLVQGDVNLLEQSNTLRQGGTLAYYDSKTKRVYVRGTELDVSRKVTLAHELTHVLQDQSFDLSKLTKLDSDDARIAFRTIVEGDATRIEDKYIQSLSQADQDAHKAQEKQDSD